MRPVGFHGANPPDFDRKNGSSSNWNQPQVEAPGQRISSLELQLANLNTKTTVVSSRITTERAYVDRFFNNLEQTLNDLTCHVNIYEQIRKNWNLLRKDIQMMNYDIGTIRKSQTALQELLKNLVEQLEELVAKETPIKEIATSVMSKTRGWLQFEDVLFAIPNPSGFATWGPIGCNQPTRLSEGFTSMQQIVPFI